MMDNRSRIRLPIPLGRAALWIASVIAPGAWLLLLVWGTDSSSYLRAWLIGSVPALACLASVWGALACVRLPPAAIRGCGQVAGLYFCTLLVLWLEDSPPLKQMPLALFGATSCFVLPAAVVAIVLRLFRWRLARHPDRSQPRLVAGKLQFHLGDAFLLTTLVAIFLGVGVTLIARFDTDPTGWDGLGLTIVVLGGLMVGPPSGILSVVFAWLILCQRHVAARWVVAALLAVCWLVLSGAALREYLQQRGDAAAVPWAVTLAIGGPALAILGLARLLGWRLIRLPRRGRASDVTTAAHEGKT